MMDGKENRKCGFWLWRWVTGYSTDGRLFLNLCSTVQYNGSGHFSRGFYVFQAKHILIRLLLCGWTSRLYHQQTALITNWTRSSQTSTSACRVPHRKWRRWRRCDHVAWCRRCGLTVEEASSHYVAASRWPQTYQSPACRGKDNMCIISLTWCNDQNLNTLILCFFCCICKDWLSVQC